MTDTLAYYDENADSFFAETADVDMAALHERFLAYLPVSYTHLDVYKRQTVDRTTA